VAYQKLALHKPDSAGVQLQIARLQMAQKDEASAMSALQKALQLEPANVDAQIAMANIKGSKGDLDGALTIARALQAQQPNAAGGLVLEGDILLAKKDAAGAVKAYERAFAINNSGLVLRKLHAAMSQAGKGKEADARLSKWIADHPDDGDSRMVMAQSSLGSGQNAAAIAQLEALLKAEPNNVIAMNNLAWAYQQNKDGRALAMAEKAMALAPENPAVLDTIGVILTEKGSKPELARALVVLQKSITLAPQALDTRLHLAQALLKSGDKERARRELQSVLDSSQAFGGREEARILMKQL
jgi:putative PEP-CTERM system TPR-repeat lipoprotein